MNHELLAPAGSLEICKEVLAAGADAVYLGGDKFGARAFAKNFTQNDIFEALDHAHLYGKKIFLTVNTLLKNREIDCELYDYLEPLYCHGLDAVIVQDYGVFQFIHKNFPELPIHISTQMSVANVTGAAFLKQRGARRIVTARELSLEEIRNIYDQTGVEIESFIHGALCYCYSGQCLMSSMLGGRSGNRGRCAQPCRLAYQVLDENGNILHKQEKYPLSPKDLCTITLLPKLCEAGIYSFKIEGRMKQLEYAAGVTEIYRKYLDMYEENPKGYQVDQKDISYLMQLGNRNGFTKGYYEMRNGRDMITLTDSSHSSGQAKEVYEPQQMKKILIAGNAELKVGEPASMSVSVEETADSAGNMTNRKNVVTVEGAVVLEAQNRPLDLEDVKKRLSKTGDTPFVFSNLQISLDKEAFLPVKQINELRRSALEMLQTRIIERYQRYLPSQKISLKTETTGQTLSEKPFLNVLVSSHEMLTEVLKYSFVDMISMDFTDHIAECRERIQKAGKSAAICFPYIFRENSEQFYHILEPEIRKFDRILVRSYDSLGYAAETLGIDREKLILDHNIYVYSGETAGAFAAEGLNRYTISLELNGKELRHMPNAGGEFLLYGYVPLMISAQCVYKNYDRCYKKQTDTEKNLYLKDRYLKKFFIKRNCESCYNVIYNSQPVSLFHHAGEIQNLNCGSYRLSFVSEDEKQIRKVLHEFEAAFIDGRPVSAPEEKESFTNGHFRRGVE